MHVIRPDLPMSGRLSDPYQHSVWALHVHAVPVWLRERRPEEFTERRAAARRVNVHWLTGTETGLDSADDRPDGKTRFPLGHPQPRLSEAQTRHLHPKGPLATDTVKACS